MEVQTDPLNGKMSAIGNRSYHWGKVTAFLWAHCSHKLRANDVYAGLQVPRQLCSMSHTPHYTAISIYFNFYHYLNQKQCQVLTKLTAP